jgi:hypothetical protein
MRRGRTRLGRSAYTTGPGHTVTPDHARWDRSAAFAGQRRFSEAIRRDKGVVADISPRRVPILMSWRFQRAQSHQDRAWGGWSAGLSGFCPRVAQGQLRAEGARRGGHAARRARGAEGAVSARPGGRAARKARGAEGTARWTRGPEGARPGERMARWTRGPVDARRGRRTARKAHGAEGARRGRRTARKAHGAGSLGDPCQVGQQPHAPPQQPPPPPDAEGPGDGAPPPRLVTATVESSFTVSVWPWGQDVGVEASLIGRLTS